jgi:CheY-like chemotaxis protein
VIDRYTFSRMVREALDHLGNRPYLERHPLGGFLYPAQHPVPAEALQRALLDAINELRPPPNTPTTSVSWRHWRYLTLRYVEGLGTKQIARELSISERHARREHLAALQAIADLLWSRLVATRRTKEFSSASSTDMPAAEGSGRHSASLEDDLEQELARLTSSTPEMLSNLGDVLQDAIRTAEPLIRARCATFHVEVPDIPSPAAVSPPVLRQILLCLITYALHDPVSEFTIKGEVSSEWIALQLTAHHIWQESSVKAVMDSESSQLLWAASRIVEKNGGRLLLKSDDHNHGVRILIAYLPIVRLTTVLVIDDSPDMAHLFQRFVAGYPYRMVQARTFPTALEFIQEYRPDIITLDVLMPAVDGWQILQQLRSSPISHDIPIIVCSILPEKPLALSLGAAGFLAKPVTASSLLEALEQCRHSVSRSRRPDYIEDTASSLPPTTPLID